MLIIHQRHQRLRFIDKRSLGLHKISTVIVIYIVCKNTFLKRKRLKRLKPLGILRRLKYEKYILSYSVNY